MIVLALKTVAPRLLPVIPWAWKKLPRNTRVGKAITFTRDRYSSRVPNVELALEAWISSEAFRSAVECLQSGALTTTDSAHVEVFVTTTGLGLGMILPEIAGEILAHFYGQLVRQLLDSERGIQIVAAKVDAVHREIVMIRESSTASGLNDIPYRPPLEADFGISSVTNQDRKAEVQLDVVKDLISKRKAGTALELLFPLQEEVDTGQLSVPLRFRFFVNKGVSLMLKGEWDRAELELSRAQTLEPTNPKQSAYQFSASSPLQGTAPGCVAPARKGPWEPADRIDCQRASIGMPSRDRRQRPDCFDFSVAARVG